jgi:hypothetical protein
MLFETLEPIIKVPESVSSFIKRFGLKIGFLKGEKPTENEANFLVAYYNYQTSQHA